jgi:cytochrome bd-type quinol oxidase subunit 1
VITRGLVVGVYAQSIFAGVLLSGEEWGRTAHSLTAVGLVVVTLVASVAAAISLRGRTRGFRLAGLLFAFALALAFQMTIGRMSADGEKLLWLHVPLGVALVVLSTQLALLAGKVGQ